MHTNSSCNHLPLIFSVSSLFFVFKQDFMKPVISSVDYLLSAGYDVNIYNGQLDLIVSTPSVLAWVNQLTWTGKWLVEESMGVFTRISE